MFFEEQLLGKKGKFALLWLAAHHGQDVKKLPRKEVEEADLEDIIESLDNPSPPLALRLLAHLLIGLVRIHYRKTLILSHEAENAHFRVKRGFTTANVNLEVPQAALDSITLTGRKGKGQLSFTVEAFPSIEHIDMPDAVLRGDSMFIEGPSFTAHHGDITVPDAKLRGKSIHIGEDDEDLGPGDDAGLNFPPLVSEGPGFFVQPGEENIDWANLGVGDYEAAEFDGDEMYEPSAAMEPQMVVLDGPVALDKSRGKKRARSSVKQIVDREIGISVETMKAMLQDSSDITIPIEEREYVPNTRKKFRELEYSLTDPVSLLSRSSFAPFSSLAPELNRLFSRQISKQLALEAPDAQMRGDDDLDLGQLGLGDYDAGAEYDIDYNAPDAQMRDDESFDHEAHIGSMVDVSGSFVPLHSEAPMPEDMGAPSREEVQLVKNPRTQAMYHHLKKLFNESEEETLSYQAMVQGKIKRTVARTFYELLVLKTADRIDVKQEAPYADITINKTENF